MIPELLTIAIGIVLLVIGWKIIKGLLELVLQLVTCLFKILFGFLALLILASVSISLFL